MTESQVCPGQGHRGDHLGELQARGRHPQRRRLVLVFAVPDQSQSNTHHLCHKRALRGWGPLGVRARVRQLRERPGWPDGPAQPTRLHPATVGAGSGCAAGTSRQQAPGGSWAALPGVQLWTWGPQTGTAGLRRPEQRRGGARRKREARGLGSEVGKLSPCSGRGLFLQVLAPAPGLQCHAQLKKWQSWQVAMWHPPETGPRPGRGPGRSDPQ